MMITRRFTLSNSWVLIGIIFWSACSSNNKFDKISPGHSGVHFQNEIESTSILNIFNYLYFYNGGGVAVGDLNGDTLPDLVFTANLKSNKIYINKGDFQFTELKDQLLEPNRAQKWTTGVTLADINADGRLDIYISEVGSYLNIEGENKLWINQGNDESGNPMFTEMAKKYGLDVIGFCTQAAFFDFDLDGDLDVYVLNHSVHSNGTFGPATKRMESHPLAGDKFFENREGKFINVTTEVGIYNSPLGYGLGITVSDINQDGYPDVYIGNDFHEDDYLYINQKNGTFKESLGEMINHTSRFSMGNDIGDINNDGLLDIFSLDMLPEEYQKLKASAGEDSYDIYTFKLNFGYKHQHARNTLQLNRGANHFSEIGLFSGVAATDWSWSGLMADFDLDGFNDLYIANGILGRTNDMDYINYVTNDEIQFKLEGTISDDELSLAKRMPKVKIPNYAFRNRGDLTFENVSKDWGLDEETFSNGAVYADLDLDGDLDLVVNNINQKASIFKNKTIETQTDINYLKFHVIGREKNPFGVGTKVCVTLSDSTILTRELYPVRGFQSSMDYSINFGLGKNTSVAKVIATFPGGYTLELVNVASNQTMVLDFNQSATINESNLKTASQSPIFEPYSQKVQLDYEHKENGFIEFNRETLIPQMVSTLGPAYAIGDINKDGYDDVFLGGAKHEPGYLFIQNGSFDFKKVVISGDPVYEDVAADFQDFNSDGFLDLIILSGGNEFRGTSKYLKPRLYLNDMVGNLVLDTTWIPEVFLNGSVLSCNDFDKDGDMDVFIGARSLAWNYGLNPTSFILENTGNRFKIYEHRMGSKLNDLGMVVGAQWADMDSNGWMDLIVASEWSTIKVIYQYPDSAAVFEVPESDGLWFSMKIADMNNDGYPDIVAGNLGLNSKFSQAGAGRINMYVSDFDDNGSIEQMITTDAGDQEQLFADKMELSKQLVIVKKKFPDFLSFSQADLTDVIEKEKLTKSLKFSISDTRSKIFYQTKLGRFISEPLPVEAQFSPVQSSLVLDINKDGRLDLLTSGNFAYTTIQRGVYDASYGELFIQNEQGKLEYVPQAKSGLFLKGDVKGMGFVKSKTDSILMVIRNNKSLLFYK